MTENYYPTGNAYVTLPTIDESGAVERINYLSMRDRGLIEICGEPLIEPIVFLNGVEEEIHIESWTRRSYWIPEFSGSVGDMKLVGRYVAPRGQKGFMLRLILRAGAEGCKGQIGIRGTFSKVLHSINESKEIEGSKHVYPSLWNQNIMFDFRRGITQFSFGFMSDRGFDHHQSGVQDDGSIHYTFCEPFILEPEEETIVNIYCGIGLEEVGAATQAVDMKRVRADVLEKELEGWLNARIRPMADAHLMQLLNLNQFFNYFYAAGRTLDTEEVVLCTSRSPRYYVSAAYWDRDSLLWSFPAFLMTDPDFAREALLYVYTRQLRNVGIHSRYIDGSVLEPGFELDELCAPILALDRYLNETGDETILSEASIQKGVFAVYERLLKERHPEHELYRTFLMPTDDMHQYPYLTYNNVLVWQSFGVFEKLFLKYEDFELAEASKMRRERVADAIWTHMIVSDQMDAAPKFAWSSDLEGHYEFYDEPPGSLTLLAYLRFVDSEDPVFQNTMEALYSDQFPYYYAHTAFEELGCSHAAHPWVLSICNSLLNGRRALAQTMLKKTKLDHFIACESIDEHSGAPATGYHFATCAGFLAYALDASREINDEK